MFFLLYRRAFPLNLKSGKAVSMCHCIIQQVPNEHFPYATYR